MAHPRVEQFRFARAEWVRGLRGLREEDGLRRLEPMNSISWMVGHLAWHERLLFAERAQGLKVEPVLDAVASGMPASTPWPPGCQRRRRPSRGCGRPGGT